MRNYKIKYKENRKTKEFEDVNFFLLKKVSDRFKYDQGSIDDMTWSDLEMNKVFAKLNNTYTLAGEEVLYYWLKTPTLNEKDYDKRKVKLNKIKSNKESFLTGLEKVGSFDSDYRAVIKKIESKQTIDKKPVFFIGSLMLMIFLFWQTQSSLFLFGACISILTIILYHYFHIARNKSALSSFDYIVRMTVFFKKNITLIKDIYSEEYDLNAIEEVANKLVEFKNKFNRLEGIDPIKDIAVALTLSTYWNYIRLINLLYSCKNEVVIIADIIGEIDCAQAIAEYLNGKNQTSEPELSNDVHSLSIEKSYNILINNCVTNNVEINNSIVITGSNMGGKSSYLRQVGINIILAQALCFSTSLKHEGGFFTVLSSISLNDDIEIGKSYFMKEAEAIQRMLEVQQEKYNTLLLIDEIFKGTNPLERLAASIEILNILSIRHNVIVTTHDIGILSYLNKFEYYHFEHNISKTIMEFDYKLKKGVTEVRNAIKLMEYIEYPKEVIEAINNRIVKMNSIA
ncbi:MAG: hypothetical protein JEZ08_05190 [Clostridiales bacterium]|nr:hypothetical protein [Clostridiales bacterium]